MDAEFPASCNQLAKSAMFSSATFPCLRGSSSQFKERNSGITTLMDVVEHKYYRSCFRLYSTSRKVAASNPYEVITVLQFT
jgi:hypothetical protein